MALLETAAVGSSEDAGVSVVMGTLRVPYA